MPAVGPVAERSHGADLRARMSNGTACRIRAPSVPIVTRYTPSREGAIGHADGQISA
jgi:hypothetical protein